jgi:hypothetical protein
MGQPNTTGRTLSIGYQSIIRVNTKETSASDAKQVAFATSFHATEEFQVQAATVLGHLGPVSLDPQGWTCTIQIDSFIPFVRNGDTYDGGGVPIIDLLPDRQAFMDESGEGITRIPYLDFYDRKMDKILASFIGIIVTSAGIQAQENTYNRNNVQMMCLDAKHNWK